MNFRVRTQLAEALGPVNRWYCSQAYGCQIDDVERLLTYFIKSGGAADFALRFGEAMSAVNRWYCSEFYRRDVREPEILWHYYISCIRGTASHFNRTAQRCVLSTGLRPFEHVA